MLSKLRTFLACTIPLLLTATALGQNTIHVGPGQTYTTIQAGINAANTGDTVLVAPGTYYENIDFTGKYISVISSAGAASTVIDGSKNNLPAVTIAPGTNALPGVGLPILLQGFTIQNGGTEPSTAPTGGIYINQMLPTITLNTLTHNHCAGIWIAETQGLIRNAPLILSNEIDNTLDNKGDCPIGGGSAIVVTGDLPALQVGASGVVDNLIQNNTQGGQEGTGSSGISVLSGSLVIQNNTLRDNITANAGGAIYLAATAVPVIQNLIYDNQAACGGGAIAIDRSLIQAGGTLLIDSNTFVDNTMSSQACVTSISQAAASQIFLDDTFSDLYGTLFANNIFSGTTSQPAIACSPIHESNGLVDLPIFDHNILYNSAGPIFDPVTCADQTGFYGNNTSDPQFVSPLTFDFHLKSSSPAIDSGQTYMISIEETYADAPIESDQDIGGQPRVVDAKTKGYAIVDMGAYEYLGTQDTPATSLQVSNSLDDQLVIPAAGGALVDLSAQTTSQAYPPPECTGSVTFFEDGAAIGTASLSSSMSTLKSVVLAPGTHYIDATYAGQAPCTSAAATPHVFLVDSYITNLTLSSNNNPSDFGQPVTFTAKITSPDPNQGGPLYLTDGNGTIPLATLTPVNGTASFTTSTLAMGNHGIGLDYRGDSTHHGSDAGVGQMVNTAATATTTTLISSLNPSTYGQSVTFKATVSGTSTPTGSITFTDGTTTLATVPLDASSNASFTTSSLTANDPGTTPNHPITATYNPTGSFATSSASLSQLVNGLPTTNTLTISPASGTTATTYTLTATLKSASSVSSATPTGTVTFYISPTNGDPGIPIGSATLTNGAATLTSSNLPVSSGFAYELYAGDTIYANNTSNAVTVNIIAAPATTTTLAITAAGSPVTAVPTGTVVTLTATTLDGPTPVTPGQVNFCDATALLCTDIHLLGTAQLTQSGTATLTFIPGPGVHSYKAVFLGTQANTTSSSPAEPLAVGPTGANPTTTTLSATGAPGDYTLTAVVSGAAYVPPTGTISFLDTTNNNYVLATAQLVADPPAPQFINSSNPIFPIPPRGQESDGTALAAADFNGDGILDIAVGESTTNTSGEVALFFGDGKGSFSFSSNFQTGAAPSQIAFVDANQDGYQDLVVVEFGSTQVGSSKIEIWLNDGKGNFSPKSSYQVPYPRSVVVQDFNGDGIPDLAILGNSGLTLFLGAGDGSFRAIPGPPVVLASAIASADFNGDGIPDLAASNVGEATVSIFLGNGDGTFTLKQNVSTASTASSLVVGDFNGDGKMDFAEVEFPFAAGAVHLGQGDGTFTTSTTLSPGDFPAFLAVADLNGDGRPDLISGDAANSGTTITAMIGDGTGSFVSSPPFAAVAGAEAIATGDFNGDGKTDFVITSSIDNTISVYLSTASIATSTATVSNISPVGTGPHLVDASYPGDTTYATSLSNTVSLTAQRVPTTLTLIAAVAQGGSPITLTAALSPNVAQNHNATGLVTFSSNGSSIGTASLSNGVASIAVTMLPAGPDNLQAQYSGDTNFAPSSGIGSITIAPPPPADFTFIGPQTITFRTESNGVATLSFASLNGFTAPIAVTCNAPLPPNYLCTLSSSTVTLAANNTASLTLTLHPNLTGRASLRTPLAPRHARTILPITLATLFPVTLFALYRNRRRRISSLLLLLCLGALTTGLTACGSDVYYAATPPGVYPISITATGTSQGNSAPTSHTLLMNADITP